MKHDADDHTLTTRWADTDIRTMAEAVDALGKAAQMLGISPELLWDRIPDVDASTALAWRRHMAENPSPAAVAAELEARAAAQAAEAVAASLG